MLHHRESHGAHLAGSLVLGRAPLLLSALFLGSLARGLASAAGLVNLLVLVVAAPSEECAPGA
jgi:hypothetical protein